MYGAAKPYRYRLSDEEGRHLDAITLAKDWAVHKMGPMKQSQLDIDHDKPSFGGLPVEILSEIVSYLDKVDLFSCFFASRRLRELSLQKLCYQTFYFFGDIKMMNQQWERLESIFGHRLIPRRWSLRFYGVDTMAVHPNGAELAGLVSMIKGYDEDVKAEWKSGQIAQKIDFENVEAFYYSGVESKLDDTIWSSTTQCEKLKTLTWLSSRYTERTNFSSG
jgi:hypothetical protein